MADSSATIAELRNRLRAFVRARDWERFHNLKDLSIALSVEASELVEHFLWDPSPEPGGLPREEREAITEELADVLIYALHLANVLDIDVSESVLSKVEKNEDRFPSRSP